MRPSVNLRRAAVLAAVAAAAIGGVALRAQQPPTPVQAERPVATARVGRSRCEDQLRVGLKAVTKADFAFIDLVVQKVEAGDAAATAGGQHVPVGAAARARRGRADYRKRPIVYFQPALVLRARAIGVEL